MLPTRFLDTAALERDYCKETLPLGAGDMVILIQAAMFTESHR